MNDVDYAMMWVCFLSPFVSILGFVLGWKAGDWIDKLRGRK